MPIDQSMVDELNMLVRFNLNTLQEGLKVHSNADIRIIEATLRLFQKKLITQPDGGYLTDLGREAAEHADALLSILCSN
ncbi:TIGR02647 family protein [Pleionea sediminis]|uniref:TIGR02647 family protein n=1 Tax=Pleionea sediminis TaxID=2569479 RepID=UPI001FEB2E91|nr:TIGR02647 family protein [Pleionea sediminis]